MKFDEVFEFIKETISESCGIESQRIAKRSTLFNDLAIRSIDIIDILFEIEMEYDISLKISDIEKETKMLLDGKPFSKRNIITEHAIEILRNKYPEMDQEKLKFGITDRELIKLLTVETLVNMVLQKIKIKNG